MSNVDVIKNAYEAFGRGDVPAVLGAMHPEIETVFLLTQPEHTHVNSTIVREIIKYGGDASIFLPDKIKISL